MRLIHSNEEYERFYYYHPKYKPKQYPTRYPCYVKMDTVGGGLMGEYQAHYVIYPPKGASPKVSKAFEDGLMAEWDRLD